MLEEGDQPDDPRPSSSEPVTPPPDEDVLDDDVNDDDDDVAMSPDDESSPHDAAQPPQQQREITNDTSDDGESLVAKLSQENKLLSLMAGEDAAEIRSLKEKLDISEAQRNRLVNDVKGLEGQVRVQQVEMGKISEQNFKDQVEAKKTLRHAYADQLTSMEEERDLLSAQADMDAETIQDLQRRLHEAEYARDHLTSKFDTVRSERDDAVSQCDILQQHADELRGSNVRLANRVSELEELVSTYEAEDHAAFFHRYSKREIREGRLRSGGAVITNAPAHTQPPPLSSPSHPTPPSTSGSATSGPQSARATASSSIGAPSSMAEVPSSQSAQVLKSDFYDSKEESQGAASCRQQPSPRSGQHEALREQKHQSTGLSHNRSNGRAASPDERLPIVDALSGKRVKVQPLSPGGLLFTSSIGPAQGSRPAYSDDEDDDEDSPTTDTPEKKKTSSNQTAAASADGISGNTSAPESEIPPTRFRTVREMRQEKQQQHSQDYVAVKKQNRKSDPPAGDEGEEQEAVNSPASASALRARPKTTPLAIEAIYGEKGTTKGQDHMYLVKYVSVEAEQWTSADFVDSNCEALHQWKRRASRR